MPEIPAGVLVSSDRRADRVAIQVWGDRYIDDAAIRGVSTDLADDGSGITFEEVQYYVTDALFSVAALVDDQGDLLERVRYTPYGEARHWKSADLDGDGDVDGSDQTLLNQAWGAIDESGYNADADIDRDGDVDSTDSGLLLQDWGAAIPVGQISEHDNPIGYAGYVFNAADATYLVRNRCYEPDAGRWLETDPLGPRVTMNLYEYVDSNPLGLTDPSGLLPDLFSCGITFGLNADACMQATDPVNCIADAGEDLLECLLAGGSASPDDQSVWGSSCSEGLTPAKPTEANCNRYKRCGSHLGANFRCMCMSGGDDDWSNYVRSCIFCMVSNGASLTYAHAKCWIEGTRRHLPSDIRDKLKDLAEAYIGCAAVQLVACPRCGADNPPL